MSPPMNRQSKEIIFKVHTFFKKRKADVNSLEYKNDANIHKLVAEATGISERSVRRVIAESKTSLQNTGEVKFSSPQRPKGIKDNRRLVNATCAINECTSTSRTKGMMFHPFPRTDSRCQEWIRACSRPDLSGLSAEQLQYTYVCQKHFEKRMYGKKNLKNFAIPTLYLVSNTKTIETQIDIEYDNQDLSLTRSDDAIKNEEDEMHSQTEEPTENLSDGNYEQVLVKREITIEDTVIHGLKAVEEHPKTLKRKRSVTDMKVEIFLEPCDKLLSPSVSDRVKAEAMGKIIKREPEDI